MGSPLVLYRLAAREDATLGMLVIDDLPFCATLEEPWKENRRRVSCIPAGTYDVDWSFSPKFGKVLPILREVKGRKYIRIHTGNHTGHISGCLLVGEKHELVRGIPWVMSSRATFERFSVAVKRQAFTLKIKWACDSPEGLLCKDC